MSTQGVGVGVTEQEKAGPLFNGAEIDAVASALRTTPGVAAAFGELNRAIGISQHRKLTPNEKSTVVRSFAARFDEPEHLVIQNRRLRFIAPEGITRGQFDPTEVMDQVFGSAAIEKAVRRGLLVKRSESKISESEWLEHDAQAKALPTLSPFADRRVGDILSSEFAGTEVVRPVKAG